MSFNFNTSEVNSKNAKAVMKPGVRVAATFEGAEVDEQGNLFFTFKNASGTLKKKEYFIDPTKPDFNEDWAKSEMERIKHIACALIPEKNVDGIQAADFKSWAGQLIVFLNTQKGTKVELHVIVNKKGFVDLPTFTNFISSELAECEWISKPQYHSYTFPNATPDAEGDIRSGESNVVDDSDDEF